MGAMDEGEIALAMARGAVEQWVQTGLLAEPPRELPPVLRERRGAFVSLHARGRLRGCIGTLVATRASLAHEIIACAVAAATQDPRFAPVALSELPALTYEVDVVGPLEAVLDPSELDPVVYGVVVEALGRRGVLLPNLTGVDTVEQQFAIARAKAGLPPDVALELYRFRVQRHVEGA